MTFFSFTDFKTQQKLASIVTARNKPNTAKVYRCREERGKRNISKFTWPFKLKGQCYAIYLLIIF
uniref:Uncharacterized protein n=1 Tax=Setaria italica TaxID=4555 RepID=K4AHR9_SETIT